METISSGVKRRRYTVEERAAIVARYEESGQTQTVFCRSAMIAVPTLSAWRRRMAKGSGALLEVPLSFGRPELTVEVKGCTLRVTVGTSPEWLAAVIARLRVCGA